MVKIDIISGFLGAGKTTLIKKLFESKKLKEEKVVLIENEFGEIGIDGTFLKESGINIKEINSGCICCSLVGDFSKSMKELIAQYNPDRIIIEPSGVGKLSDIIGAVAKVDEDLKINILATVVDGGKTKMYIKNFGEFFINQVSAADSVVIGKVDKISEDKLVEAVNAVKEINDKANILTTDISTLDGDKLLSFLEEKISLKDDLIKETLKNMHDDDEDECDDPNCSCHHHHHHHDDDDDEDEEHEHHHHHECCCCHGEEDEDEHEHHHHHHDEEECDDEECECHHHHHHHDDDDDEDEEHEHHHHDHECCCCHGEEDEEEHEHHHHHHDEEECDDPNCSCHHHHHHHHGHDADEVFTSWGEETPRAYSHNELETILKALCDEEAPYGIILRSKGILKASDNDKWYYFDLVAGDYEIRLGEPDYTGRIVVIGSHIDEDKISSLFKK